MVIDAHDIRPERKVSLFAPVVPPRAFASCRETATSRPVGHGLPPAAS